MSKWVLQATFILWRFAFPVKMVIALFWTTRRDFERLQELPTAKVTLGLSLMIGQSEPIYHPVMR